MSWNQKFIRKLELIVIALGETPILGDCLHWEERVLRLLDQITANVGAGTGESVVDYIFTTSVKVPSGSGILFFDNSKGVPVSATPATVLKASTFVGAAVTVDTPDATQGYEIPIFIGGIALATLSLPAGTTSASLLSGGAISAGATVAPFWNRTSGSAKSDFSQATLNLQWKEN